MEVLIAGSSPRRGPARWAARRWAPAALVLALGAPAAGAVVHPAALLSERDPAVADAQPDAQLHCLALNVYHEARSEPDESRLAVAVVTLNRVRSERFPNTVCRVVWQRGQFSWTQDGRPDRPYNLDAWRASLRVARIAQWQRAVDSIDYATHYHATYVRPAWASRMRLVARIGRHLLYAPD